MKGDGLGFDVLFLSEEEAWLDPEAFCSRIGCL